MTDPKDLLIAFYEAIIERNAHRMFQMTPEESKYLRELKQQISEAEFKNEYLNKLTPEASQIEKKIVEPIPGHLYYIGVDPISGDHPMSNHTELAAPQTTRETVNQK